MDLFKLVSKFVRRERYPSITPAEAVADMAQAKAKYFTLFDALKGYNQCPLDEASQDLMIFITPFGQFKYLHAPYYSISSISEHYNQRMDEAFAGMHNFRKVVDDVFIYNEDKTENIKHVQQFLHHCEENHIALNREKFRFCQTEVSFAGFELNEKLAYKRGGARPAQWRPEAIMLRQYGVQLVLTSTVGSHTKNTLYRYQNDVIVGVTCAIFYKARYFPIKERRTVRKWRVRVRESVCVTPLMYILPVTMRKRHFYEG